MITIPKQLQNQRFILLNPNRKPRQMKWSSVNNHELNSNIFQEFLENNNIYGVPCGFNNLIVLDFDDQETQNALLPHLPDTFAVYSANKRLLHLYYFTDDTSSMDVDKEYADGQTSRILDIQGRGSYVVGPNSVTDNGKCYDIAKDLPIATLYKDDIKTILKLIPFKTIIHDSFKKQEKQKLDSDLDMFLNPEVVKIKQNYKIKDLLQELGIPIHKNPTMCPLGHDSINKACFSFNDNLWHCFHCGKSGDVITLFELAYKHDFMQAKNILFKKLFINEEKYELALKNLYASIIARKNKAITTDDINTIANTLIKKYLFITTIETDVTYNYVESEGIYKPKGDIIVKQEAEKYFKELCKNNIISELVAKVKRLTYRPLSIFDSQKDLICLKNGVFNLETKLLIPHSPDYYFINNLPINFNTDSKCPKIQRFFTEIVNPDDVELLYELFAFMLMRNYKIQKAVIFVGSGSNGKSVLLSLAKSFIGESNISAESLQRITEDAFSTSSLYGKFANISGDIPDKRLNDSSIFKALTSGKDPISAQFKHQNKFTFINYAKLFFSCNTMPKTSDSTDGFYRRWVIINFPNSFEGTADNKNLTEELTTEEELSGLFNKALEKYFRIDRDGLSYTKTTDENREIYENLSDPVQVFLDTELEFDDFTHLPFREVYERFVDFCKRSKCSKPTDKYFGSQLKRKNIKRSITPMFKDDKMTSVNEVVGYKWKSNAMSNEVIVL